MQFITVRNSGKVMFLHLSLILFTGGGWGGVHPPGQTPPRQTHPHPTLGRHPQTNPPNGRHPHPLGRPPPSPRRPLQRTVRILLECILVLYVFMLYFNVPAIMYFSYLVSTYVGLLFPILTKGFYVCRCSPMKG